MIGVNDRRLAKPEKGILDFKKICTGIVNGFNILIASLIDNDEKLASSIKTVNIPNSSRLECKNHTQFETKMTKIDTL